MMMIPMLSNSKLNHITPFRIFTAENDLPNFTFIKPKMLGSRDGVIGKFSHLKNSQWMIKTETQNVVEGIQDFYPTECAKILAEAVALESLISQLILAMFQGKYATNIQVMKIGDRACHICREFLSDVATNNHRNQFLILPANTYCIVSEWKENCSNLFSLNQQDLSYPVRKKLNIVATIAKLFGIEDFKAENIILDEENNIYLVDCAGSFIVDEENLLTPKISIFEYDFYLEDALQIIKGYCDFDRAILDKILTHYREMMSYESIMLIEKRMISNQQRLSKIYELELKKCNKTNTQTSPPYSPYLHNNLLHSSPSKDSKERNNSTLCQLI